MTNTSIVAKVYGGDYKYAAMLTVVSTLLAVITTPFLYVGAAWLDLFA